MNALRKKDGYFFSLSPEVYDLDGNEYQWDELILCPERDEEVNGRLKDCDIEALRRRYFGQVMQGFLSNPTYSKDTIMANDISKLIDHAYAIADSMIEKLQIESLDHSI